MEAQLHTVMRLVFVDIKQEPLAFTVEVRNSLALGIHFEMLLVSSQKPITRE